MAHIIILGSISDSLRDRLALLLREVTCEVLGLDITDKRQYSREIPPKDSYRGEYFFYIRIECDKTVERSEKKEEMAALLGAKAKELAVQAWEQEFGIKLDEKNAKEIRDRTGVWLILNDAAWSG